MNNINRGARPNSQFCSVVVPLFFLSHSLSVLPKQHRVTDSPIFRFPFVLVYEVSSSSFLFVFFALSRFALHVSCFTDLYHRIAISLSISLHAFYAKNLRSAIFVVFRGDFSRSTASLRFAFKKRDPICLFTLNLTQSDLPYLI